MTSPILGARAEAFLALMRAAEHGRLALVQCTDARSGEIRHVICAEIGRPNILIPFGHLQEDKACDAYRPPPGWTFAQD